MAITFDKPNRIIFIPAPDIEVTIQELVYAIRDYEDSQLAMDIPKIADASGKESLGGGVSVGITLKLLDWKLKFEDRAGPTTIVVNVTGGNLVAVDENGDDVNPIEPSTYITVTKTASSSATTTDIQSIRTSIFGGAVCIDISGSAGTIFPIGTLENPVNNINDAIGIATTYNLKTFCMLSDFTLPVGSDIQDFIVETRQRHSNTYTFIVQSASNVDNTSFENIAISGNFDGNFDVKITDCHDLDIENFNGQIHGSGLAGTMSLSVDGTVDIINCYSKIPGNLTPIINFNNSGVNLGVRAYAGGLKLINKTGTGSVSLDFISGQVQIASTCVSGTIVVRGVAKLTDNSGVNCFVDSSSLVNPFTVANQTWEEKLADHTGSVESAGYALDNVSAGASPAIIADAVWDESIADHQATGSTGEALTLAASGSGTASINVVEIVDGVWNAQQSGYTLSGSFGELLSAVSQSVIQTSGTVNTILETTYVISSSVVENGIYLQQISQSVIEISESVNNIIVDSASIAQAVWSEQLSPYTSSAGTAGYTLYDISQNLSISGSSPTAVADAVWDESLSEHTSSEASAASRMGFIYGLMQSNFRMVDMVYDSNKLMTAAKLRIYTNSIDADADTNYLKQWLLTAVYTDGKLTDYIVKE